MDLMIQKMQNKFFIFKCFVIYETLHLESNVEVQKKINFAFKSTL